MTALFSTVLDMSLMACPVIAVILLLRLPLKKAPKKYSYALWAIAGFRLIFPGSIESAFSIFNLQRRAAAPKAPVTAAPVSTPIINIADAVTPTAPPASAPPVVSTFAPAVDIPISTAPPAGDILPPAATAAPTAPAAPALGVMDILAILWCLGMAALLIYSVVSYIRLKRRMATATLLEDNIYRAEGLASPFILGFFRPRIYIPYGLEGDELSYVLAHERCHLKRGDHIIKPLAFLILILHWFDPLVWLAFILMSKDMEMSCDEKLLAKNEGIRKAYSSTLLSFASNRRFPAPGPLAFGEGSVRSRIKNVLHWKKPALWVTIAAVLVCITTILICSTDARTTLSEAESVYSGTDTVSDDAAGELIAMINGSSKRRFYPDLEISTPLNSISDIHSMLRISCADGSRYILHYQYYGGFSFSEGREDDYRSILTLLDENDKFEKHWRMSNDFDDAFRAWLDENELEYRAPDGTEFITGKYIYISQSQSTDNPIPYGMYVGRDRKLHIDSVPIGSLENIALNKDRWDKLIRSSSAGKWRRQNSEAWRCISGSDMYYLLLQKNGSIWLAKGFYDIEGETDPYSDDSSIYAIREFLPASEAEVYAAAEQVYARTTISDNYRDELTRRYTLTADRLEIFNMTDGETLSYERSTDDFVPLPFSREEWEEMFTGKAFDVFSYDDVGYLAFDDPARVLLLSLDGELFLVSFGAAGGYSSRPKYTINSISALVPESTLSPAYWEYQPALSSRAPYFRFEFDVAYSRMDVIPSSGTVLVEQEVKGENDSYEYVNFVNDIIFAPQYGALCWSPAYLDSLGYGRVNSSTTALRLMIRLSNGWRAQGVIGIEYLPDGWYKATLHSDCLHMEQDDTGRIVIRYEASEDERDSYIAALPMYIYNSGTPQGMTLSCNTASIVADWYAADRIHKTMIYYDYIPTEAPSTEPNAFNITMDNGQHSLTIWSGSESDTLIYKGSCYLVKHLDRPGLAEDLRLIFEDLCEEERPDTPEFSSDAISSKLNQWQAEGVTELSKTQCAELNDMFEPFVRSRMDIRNKINGFFQARFDRPEDIRLYDLLKYSPISAGEASEEEYRTIAEQYSDRAPIDLPGDFIQPAHRFTSEAIDELLREYTGIGLDDLSDEARESMLYIPEYDTYYNFTSDMGAGTYSCHTGRFEDDTLILSSYIGTGTPDSRPLLLTFKRSGDRWYIYSFNYDPTIGVDEYLSNRPTALYGALPAGEGLPVSVHSADGESKSVLLYKQNDVSLLNTILRAYSYSYTEAPPTEPSEYWISIGTEADALTVWHSSGGDILSCGGHYYKVLGESSLAEKLRSADVLADVHELLSKWHSEGRHALEYNQRQLLNNCSGPYSLMREYIASGKAGNLTLGEYSCIAGVFNDDNLSLSLSSPDFPDVLLVELRMNNGKWEIYHHTYI